MASTGILSVILGMIEYTARWVLKNEELLSGWRKEEGKQQRDIFNGSNDVVEL